MDFIGSKQKINQWIFSIIYQRVPSNSTNKYTFIDICSGSGATSKYALSQGFNLISNDIMSFPSVIVDGLTLSSESKYIYAQKIIQDINNLQGVDGFFFREYCPNGHRLYFTDDNARRIDACRQYISLIKDTELRNYLLYCGLEALSSVSNTTGVHGAFLKKFKPRAIQQFMLKAQEPIITRNKKQTYKKEMISLLKSNVVDIKDSILYIDPPYNARQYPPNYHLYETFVLYDNPLLKGLTGIRKEWKSEGKSLLCSKEGFLITLKEAILHSNSKYIYLSYSSDGLVTQQEIITALQRLNVDISFFTLPTTRYCSDISINRVYDKSLLNEWLIEIIPR